MTLLLWQKIAIVIATAGLMEGFAWWAHKYVMHGWAWSWHRSHHEPHDNWLEKNDLFAVLFGAFAAGLFVVGWLWVPALWYVGAGISVYGIVYAFVHDGLVHQRWPFRWVPKNGYARRLVQAHRLHHAVTSKGGNVSFGFVLAPDPKRLHAALREFRAERQANGAKG